MPHAYEWSAGEQPSLARCGRREASRNGRRAVLSVSPDLTIVDDVITAGTQVAAKLLVGTTVVAAPETSLPAWARLGQESSRMLSD